jgi:hypothetical protein
MVAKSREVVLRLLERQICTRITRLRQHQARTRFGQNERKGAAKTKLPNVRHLPSRFATEAVRPPFCTGQSNGASPDAMIIPPHQSPVHFTSTINEITKSWNNSPTKSSNQESTGKAVSMSFLAGKGSDQCFMLTHWKAFSLTVDSQLDSDAK